MNSTVDLTVKDASITLPGGIADLSLQGENSNVTIAGDVGVLSATSGFALDINLQGSASTIILAGYNFSIAAVDGGVEFLDIESSFGSRVQVHNGWTEHVFLANNLVCTTEIGLLGQSLYSMGGLGNTTIIYNGWDADITFRGGFGNTTEGYSMDGADVSIWGGLQQRVAFYYGDINYDFHLFQKSDGYANIIVQDGGGNSTFDIFGKFGSIGVYNAGAGNDRLKLASNGVSLADGEDGKDRFVSEGDEDSAALLWGGAGADRFIIAGKGQTTINDFCSADGDTIVFRKAAGDVRLDISDNGDGTQTLVVTQEPAQPEQASDNGDGTWIYAIMPEQVPSDMMF